MAPLTTWFVVEPNSLRPAAFRLCRPMMIRSARTSAATLPPDVEDSLRALMSELGLVYGAVDLRLTPEGEYVFLEVNPAGEFLFSEHGSGQPITDAVASWLAAPT